VPNGGYDHEEIERLREWRHKVVTPELAALWQRVKRLERSRSDSRAARRSAGEYVIAACAIAALVLPFIRH
jgi:hypothetical protein